MTFLRPKGRAVPQSSRPMLEPGWSATLEGHLVGLRWSPDGRFLAAAVVDGPLTIFDARGGRLHELSGHRLGTAAIDWQPGAPVLASAGQDGHVRLWDVETGRQTAALRHVTSWVERVAWHPSGRYLAAAAGKCLRIWDQSGALLCDHTDHASTIADIGWKPGSNQIAAVAYGGTTLWAPDRKEPVYRYAWKGSSLVLAWSPNAEMFATGDQDQTVHFWYARSGLDLQMWGYETKMRELSWDPSSRYLATGGGCEAVVWDTQAGKHGPEGSKPVMLSLHSMFVSALAYQRRIRKPDPPLLASAGQDGVIALWRPAHNAKPLARHTCGAPVTQLDWSFDDQKLAAGCADGTVAVFEAGDV